MRQRYTIFQLCHFGEISLLKIHDFMELLATLVLGYLLCTCSNYLHYRLPQFFIYSHIFRWCQQISKSYRLSRNLLCDNFLDFNYLWKAVPVIGKQGFFNDILSMKNITATIAFLLTKFIWQDKRFFFSGYPKGVFLLSQNCHFQSYCKSLL